MAKHIGQKILPKSMRGRIVHRLAAYGRSLATSVTLASSGRHRGDESISPARGSASQPRQRVRPQFAVSDRRALYFRRRGAETVKASFAGSQTVIRNRANSSQLSQLLIAAVIQPGVPARSTSWPVQRIPCDGYPEGCGRTRPSARMWQKCAPTIDGKLGGMITNGATFHHTHSCSPSLVTQIYQHGAVRVAILFLCTRARFTASN